MYSIFTYESSVRIWDTRKLDGMPVDLLDQAAQEEDDSKRAILDFEHSIVTDYIGSAKGKGTMRAEWKYDKSASSAYWDPRGRQIVSTSYDDYLRCMCHLLLLFSFMLTVSHSW